MLPDQNNTYYAIVKLFISYQQPVQIIKRFFDFAIAFIALVLLTPILMVIFLTIWLHIGNPVFFTQLRPGLWGKPFRILKFRTMLNAADQNGNLLSDAERLTSLGQFLRSSSLDELPGLWNVLKGDMSIIGPRPLLMEYLDLYSSEQSRRHDVRPGITGWAQVNGRNAISWEEKFKLDVWYVDNRRFLLDIKILLMTLIKVLNRNDITHAGHATIEKFQGSVKYE